MKTKSINRVIAFVTALFLLLTCFAFSPIVTRAHAAGNTYVLDGGDLPTAGEGTYKDGDSFKAGTSDYFTVYASAKTKIEDKTGKKFGDGYESKKRLNFNGGVNVGTPKDTVAFTTGGAATVKVWWGAGDAGRQMIIKDASDKQIAVTSGTTEKDALYLSTLKVSAAGKYFLGGDPKKNYIFKIEVTEEAAAQDYVLESKTLATFDAGAKADGDSVKAGTDDFFTIIYSAKSKVDGSDKKFDDGYTASPRINFGGKAGTDKNAVKFITGSAATVKVWWAEGGEDNRQMVILDSAGKEVTKTTGTHTKNSAYIDTLELANAGTYFLGGDTGNNYIFKIQVTAGGATVERGDWSKVAAPVITSAADDGNGGIVVKVTADVSANGGDAVVVKMTDQNGKEETKQSLAEGTSHELTFNPENSGNYTFKASLEREGETPKTSAEKSASFKYPLGAPTITSATNKGNGAIELKWTPVDEATGYNIYCDGTKVGSVNGKEAYTATGLTTGKKYSFTVEAVRNTEVGKTKSAAVSVTATKEAQREWSSIIYGTSTNTTDCGFVGSINEDGKVTVFSENGRGKIQPGSNDGIAFYYTAIPADKNFTFRAKVHVDSWTYSNGQDGFGLLAIDSVPEKISDEPFWSNQYMLVVSKMEYWWDREYEEVDYSGNAENTKYTMTLGVGVNTKLGIDAAGLEKIKASDADYISQVCGVQYPLDFTAVNQGLDAGTYNIAGNATNESKVPTSIANLTDFDFEIQKNNTGYFLTYYGADGKVIGQQKFYDPDALEVLDKDNVYVGFFAARNARATYSDVKITLTDPKNDAPAEEEPEDVTRAGLNVSSGTHVNKNVYTAEYTPMVDGKVDISVNGKSVVTRDVKGGEVYESAVPVVEGTNKVVFTFTPADGQKATTKTKEVVFDTYLAKQTNLYVSPKGTKYGNGTKDHPLDIYTAVGIARAGQKIILMEGTYKLTKTVDIERGMDGEKNSLIYMIADPDAKTRPVLDAEGRAIEIIKDGGDYWYFQGFDVCNTGGKKPGFRVAGSNCVLDDITAYHNTDTGIFIKAYRDSSDSKDKWPANNLILNCTSYGNCDSGMTDADGFAAKLTCGEGNVFDGCVAYNNADDGWDCYSRVIYGPIGAVTIKNCVAYNNGYLEDGTNAGDGNGFKMGGDNIAVPHKIENSISFNNKLNGITCNSDPAVIVENCTSYNNESSDVALYSNVTGVTTSFKSTGVISFKDGKIKSGLSKAENFDGLNQTESDVKNATTYYWDGSKSVNTAGKEVTADMFKSLTFKGSVARNADNTINMEGFLELTDKAPKDAGARMTGKASEKIEVTPDADVPNPRTGAEIGFTIAIIALAGAAVLVLVAKRRKANG